VRKDTAAQFPELGEDSAELAKKLDTATMTDLNYQVDVEHNPSRMWLATG